MIRICNNVLYLIWMLFTNKGNFEKKKQQPSPFDLFAVTGLFLKPFSMMFRLSSVSLTYKSLVSTKSHNFGRKDRLRIDQGYGRSNQINTQLSKNWQMINLNESYKILGFYLFLCTFVYMYAYVCILFARHQIDL
jgi:hypothetical protein